MFNTGLAVHHVLRFAVQVCGNIRLQNAKQSGTGLIGRPGNVGSNAAILCVQQGIVSRRRLGREHIRTRRLPACRCLTPAPMHFVHHRSAAGVDKDRAVFHLVKGRRVHHTLGVRCQGTVASDDVAVCQHRIRIANRVLCSPSRGFSCGVHTSTCMPNVSAICATLCPIAPNPKIP